MKKNYLIVGGSHGIGFEIVKKLSAEGHRIQVLSRTAGDLPTLDGEVEHHVFDILKDEFPGLPDSLDGLAYCPGSINLRSFATLKPDQFREEFELNCIGAVRTVQAAQKVLKNAPSGSAIVLFSTVAVGVGMPFHASIAAAKGAVEGLTRSLAAELAPAVRVNCIAPSLTDTPLAARLLSSDEKREASAQRHPLRRVGSAAELAELATFLLSPAAGWITGQVIHADGGMSAVKI